MQKSVPTHNYPTDNKKKPLIIKTDDTIVFMLKAANRLNTTYHAMIVRQLWLDKNCAQVYDSLP